MAFTGFARSSVPSKQPLPSAAAATTAASGAVRVARRATTAVVAVAPAAASAAAPGLKACDGDAEPFEAALWHGAAALAALLPPSAALPLPLASALLLRLETRLRPGAGANLATVAAAAATTAPAVCACALGPQQLLQVLRLLDGLLDGAVINSRPAAGGTHPGSAARIAAPLAALAREVVARANAALGGVDRQQALSTALLSSVKRLHALAEAAGGGQGGHAVDCVEAHEAGWAVMNLMEDGPPTVGVALFGASPAEGAAGTMLMEYATRVGEKRRADASVATLQCEEEAARRGGGATTAAGGSGRGDGGDDGRGLGWGQWTALSLPPSDCGSQATWRTHSDCLPTAPAYCGRLEC